MHLQHKMLRSFLNLGSDGWRHHSKSTWGYHSHSRGSQHSRLGAQFSTELHLSSLEKVLGLSITMYLCMQASSVHTCIHTCIHACMPACRYVCIYVCMHVCMHVCVYVWMHVFHCISVFKFYVWSPAQLNLFPLQTSWTRGTGFPWARTIQTSPLKMATPCLGKNCRE